MYNQVEQQRYEAFEAYQKDREANLAPRIGEKAVGATIALSLVSLGLAETYQPKTEIRENTFSPSTTRELGSTALISQMVSRNELEIDFEPRAVYTGRRTELGLAA